MLATELDIKKKGKLYQLKYKNKRIRCYSSEDFVEHENQELIEFIREDLYRCGELNFRKNQRLHFKTTPCAYYLFSSDKNLIKPDYYEGRNFDEFISNYLLCDFLFLECRDFIQKELFKVRNIIRDKIGSENYRNLTLYSLHRSYYNGLKIYDTDGIGYGYGFNNQELRKKTTYEGDYSHTDLMEELTTWIDDDDYENMVPPEMGIGWNRDNYKKGEKAWISEKEFSKGEVPKIILKIFNECTEFEKASILTLFHNTGRYSFLIPLAYIRGWINKRDYISSSMVVKELKGIDKKSSDHFLYAKHDHQDLYKSLNELSVLCFNFANIGTKSQRDLWNKIKQGESTTVEFKETLSLDIRESQKKDFNLKKERKKIEHSVLKTIAGFLNSEGGTLFIGVRDKNNEIVGIGNEKQLVFGSSIDKMRLHLENLINREFDKGNPLIKVSNPEVFKKSILVINCSPSKKPVFIDGKFYIRKGPRTDDLNTEEYHNYLEQN
ncbi:Hypothetical protein P9215_04491 [Prochlorococcus marinus str. MIT 9215]|uniref:Schlafen AlbA-2 domain-containing protein n=1 Tax=Prochlorococcus marinus (strain MIT 9215) TaxID=93060 RepID=A8G384_PROM2|nr:ATP-binding protein [Prochlorococcus marinus]ABV50065.1 Hypothetical protein P9215_04491 [Prochlorococcus marinus str. MIT 9215]